jgi:hypothetical protein
MKTETKNEAQNGNLQQGAVSGMLLLDEIEITELAKLIVGYGDEGYIDRYEVVKVERIIRATQNKLIHKNSKR